MLRVGITGGIGSGKTAVTDWLAQKNIQIVDADVVARLVVAPGMPALAEIAQTFGAQYLQPDGQLDRPALRQLVFADEHQRKLLEAITHPSIRAELEAQLQSASSPYVVLSSPLLLEGNQSEMVDIKVVVDVPESLQIERTMARDQNDQALVEKIMAAQLDRETRRSRADIVIDNSECLKTLHHRTDALHQTLLARARTLAP
ncbi:dephospho-CoA kinase [Luminiphilus sp.]|jgi:dephospho-CoA kinase|nr:dephospho-CoA kinase [Luminiphilus sp.]MDC0411181.1 dephospho-CoA kinase [Luminiphilus sp.]